MGLVLRARDTKLLRDVALKVLPDHFAEDPDRVSRLQREAQVLASLNHPNIAQVYGLEQLGNSGCIVMELVEGETLSERLKNGPVPAGEAMDIARQIADALAAAHERGIVHRDLKPANIKLTPSGVVKVLDFGLAKALATQEKNTQLTSMPTKVSGSVAGMVVGTIGYMSPEQARGKEVDARTDIWAFGCVVYEMLTARQAFEGETATDMIAKIVSGEPDLTLLPADTPRPVRMLLEATLQKNPQQRLQHIGDMRLFLNPNFMQPAAEAAGASKTKQGKLWIAAFAAGLLVAAIPAAWYFRTPPPPNAPEMRFELALPGLNGTAILLSPDGQRLAYSGNPDEQRSAIWIRPLAADNPQKLAGTDGAGFSFWSPDSRYLAMIVDGKLKKIDVLGGAPVVLADFSGQPRGAAWSSKGVILYATSPDNIIYRISDSGGQATPLMKLDAARKEILHAAPVFLPDGEHFIFLLISSSSTEENSGFYLGSLAGDPPVRLGPIPAQINGLAYVEPGYFLYNNGQTVMAQRMDPKRRTFEGNPVPIAEGAQNSYFTASNAGLVLFRKASGVQPTKTLTWYDRSGKPVGQIGASANYGNVELSPKGDRAAVDMIANNNRDIWVIDIARGVPSRVTFDNALDWSPSWSPDGSKIIYASGRATNDVYQKSSSGIGNEELIFKSDKNEVATDWSPDGRYVLFSRGKKANNIPYDTWLLDLAGGNPTESILVDSPFDKAFARVSPDGRFVAYATNDSGPYQIVVQSFPDATRGKWQITAQGGVEPKWRHDSRELYYLALDGKLMAVPVKGDGVFGAPEALFETPLTVPRQGLATRDRRYDVSPDGRFLMVVPASTGAPAPVVAVLNWMTGLQKKL
jgi:Tol biopolymer transport system component